MRRNPIAYHGSPHAFSIGEARIGAGAYGPGLYFTTSRILAYLYSMDGGADGFVYECNVNLKNPINFAAISEIAHLDKKAHELLSLLKASRDRQHTENVLHRLQKMGYDGVVVHRREEKDDLGFPRSRFVKTAEEATETIYVVFSPRSLRCTSTPSESFEHNPSRFPWPRIWLKKGTVLYHGTSSEHEFDMPDAPAWFSEAPEVAWYFARRSGEGEPRVLKYRVVKAVQLALIRGRADMDRFRELIGEHYGEPQEMAELTCRAGFDGWCIPNNYPEGSDTLLCDPDSILVKI